MKTMHPTEQAINEYVDGELRGLERAEVAQHLQGCAACAVLAEDLRRLTRAAATLEPMPPPAQAWARIDRAIGRQQGSRRSTHQWTWLAAAAAIVLAAVATVQWRQAEAPPASAAVAVSDVMLAEVVAVEKHYDEAFKGLEQIANAERAVLDEATSATIMQNLALVDKAIVESRTAVEQEPTNEPAHQSLIESFKMKLALLQDTVALINELRKNES